MLRRILFTLILALLVAPPLIVFLHYRYTGLTPHRYASLVVNTIEAPGSPRRQVVADFVRNLTLNSGLIADPIQAFPPDLQMPLPTWRGRGANALRQSVTPRYLPNGQPIALADINRWLLHEPETPMATLSVASVDELTRAIATAEPGTRIVLVPGTYDFDTPLLFSTSGTPRKPLQLTASHLGEAVLAFRDGGELQIEGAYWTLSDLIIRGECGADPCSTLVMLGGEADHFTARNVFVSGVERLLEAGPNGTPANKPLVEGITLINGEVAASGLLVSEWNSRLISQASAEGRLIVLCPTATSASDCDTASLEQAARQVAAGGMILIRQGDYRQAAHFKTPGVHLLAEPGARLLGVATEGKGALVVSASITVEGMECSGIAVNSGNGACLRQNSGDVTLLGVHFHHSEMGLLTGHEGGEISIFDSYFHDNGASVKASPGQNHNIYVNSGRLTFSRSWSLMARNAGHEVKSRAAHTRLDNCLVASVNARDSRLLDVPEGGVLEVSGCVLGEGPRSENWDMIGYGLEIREGESPYAENSIRLVGNTFYSDRPQGESLLHAERADIIVAEDNVGVGIRQAEHLADMFPDRDAALVPQFPVLQPLVFR
ncbi:MAG: chondroitinase-B domain-containing protein [Gammaproteobacteria bacterium]